MKDVFWARDAAVLAAFRAIAEIQPGTLTTAEMLLAKAGELADAYEAYEGGLSMEQFVREMLQ